MNVTRRDRLFAGVVAAVLLLLLLSTGTNKARRVPDDDRHRPLGQRLSAGSSRQVVERECPNCHSSLGTPLPRTHPPKEQCLICHQMKVT